MYIQLKSYLGRLEELENSRPSGIRRDVPSISQLADDLGVHRVTLSNIANGRVQDFNLKLGGRLITVLRRRGFEVNVSDIIAYRGPEEETQA